MVAVKGKGWQLAPSLLLIVQQFDRVYPQRDRRSDGSIGDQAHANRESDHNPHDGFVHAVDIDEDVAAGRDLASFAAALEASRDPRIRYVIYEGRILKAYPSNGKPAWTWHRYTGPNAHTQHLHLSINRTASARDDLRPWPLEEDDVSYTDEDRGRDNLAAFAVGIIHQSIARIERWVAAQEANPGNAELNVALADIKEAVKQANREGTG